MSKARIRVLLVEDDPDVAGMERAMLARAEGVDFDVTEATTVSAATTLLSQAQFDVALLDLSLPDSAGLQTLAAVRSKAPDLPVVVLTGLDDQVTAMKALHSGAQDYLVKGQDTASSLARSARYAIARKRMEALLERSMEWERDSWERSQELHEYRHYLTMSKGPGVDAAAGAPHMQILPAPEEEALEDLVAPYRELVLRYADAERAGEGRPAAMLRQFAERLARVRARARDVAQVHLSLMGETPVGTDAHMHRRLLAEAPLVFADVLGSLADVYLREAGGPRTPR